MARINVEETIWSDPRFKAFRAILNGDEELAMGCLVAAWRSAQSFFKVNGVGIPKPIFMHLRNASGLLDSGLASIKDDFVYLIGSRDQFSWLGVRVQSGGYGGRASGKAKREIIDESSKQKAEKSEKPKPLTLTLPLSLSLNTKSKTENTDFDALWKAYPRGEKAEAKKRFEKYINPSNIENFKVAVRHYLEDCRKQDRFLKDLSTFIGSKLRGHPWESYVEAPIEPPIAKPVASSPCTPDPITSIVQAVSRYSAGANMSDAEWTQHLAKIKSAIGPDAWSLVSKLGGWQKAHQTAAGGPRNLEFRLRELL